VKKRDSVTFGQLDIRNPKFSQNCYQFEICHALSGYNYSSSRTPSPPHLQRKKTNIKSPILLLGNASDSRNSRIKSKDFFIEGYSVRAFIKPQKKTSNAQ
jgi:hypothetical protein